jgi:DNA-binding IclR family transcriptional regulator
MSKPKQKESGETAKPARKTERALELLRREGGASISEMCEATGWLPHSARAMLTGFRKRGIKLERTKVDGAGRYSVSGELAA